MTDKEKLAYINEWKNNKSRYMARYNKNKQYVHNTSSKQQQIPN